MKSTGNDEVEQAQRRPGRLSVPEEKRATEYLANERTFLAWIRTSIAVVSMGFVITRFRSAWPAAPPLKARSASTSFTLGTGLMAFGALLAILAVWRYYAVNRAIEQGRVQPDRGLVILVTVLVVLISVGTITFMLLAE